MSFEYRIEVDNKGSSYSRADDQQKIVFKMPKDKRSLIAYLANKQRRNATYLPRPLNNHRALNFLELKKIVRDIVEMELAPFPSDRKKYEAFLKTDMGERLKYEHCDSAEELKFVIDGLRSRGLLNSSKGIQNLVDAVIDEARLADRLVRENQVKNHHRVPAPRPVPKNWGS